MLNKIVKSTWKAKVIREKSRNMGKKGRGHHKSADDEAKDKEKATGP